jgi:sugar/nucleoside kinase (ribokinase family)
MKQFDIITIGSALRDVMFYSDELAVRKNPKKDPTLARFMCAEYGAKIRSENVHFEFGGGAANSAVNLGGLQLKTGIITAIGNDFDGVALLEHLKEKKVDTSLIQYTTKHRTGFSFLAVDEHSGEHVAYVYYGAAYDLMISTELLRKHPTKWYYITSLNAKKWKEVLKHLYAQKKTQFAWNPGGTQLQAGYTALKQYIAQTDILILNRDEAAEFVLSHPDVTTAGTVKQMLKRIHSWGATIVVITDGRKGAHAYDGEHYYFHDAPKDKPKDTTGAGDCFGSTFVAGFIQYNQDIEKSMDLAVLNASSLVRTIGAQHGFLTWEQLPKRLQQ